MNIELTDPGMPPKTISTEMTFLAAIQKHGGEYTSAFCLETREKAWRPLGEPAWKDGTFGTFVADACREEGFEPPRLWNVRHYLDLFEYEGVPLEDIVEDLLKGISQ